MKRREFIERYGNASLEEKIALAQDLKKEGAGRKPDEELIRTWHSLDDVTNCKETYLETEFGSTHVYLVEGKSQNKKNRAVVINVHGGGWVRPHGERDIYFSRRIANRLECLVMDVDYVLTPEHPYPDAINELKAVVHYVNEHAQDLGIDPKRTVMSGQSSGAHQVLAAARGLRNEEGVHLAGIVCAYMPAELVSGDPEEELEGRVLVSEIYNVLYCRNDERTLVDVSPALAAAEDFRGLCPVVMMTGGLDNLKKGADTVYALMRQAGVDVGYRCFENSRHGFLVNLYDEWQDGEDYIVQQIKKMIQ